ncbi:SDR family NAD(P)-dependent oxidoreductase [Moorella sulfitireducens]|uniref:SDR family NAD(P)-dependent oxidoreductase n=1 Tax=Neomoorella sulfitireducens TaxID=2972948 RepID=UPI0021AD36F0|nr:glucose 1-dehydrogenase [Moorella sulfitireducens]
MNFNYLNKVVLITGGGLGIGRAASLLFAEHGAKVVIADLNEKNAQETVGLIKEKGGEACYFIADIAEKEQVEALFKAVLEKCGRIDVLVNNAGIYYQGNAVETPVDVWDKIMAVNLKGAYLCSREVIPVMEKQGGGVIINVSSEAGLVGIKGQVAYNVSKAGLIGLTRSMAVDHAPIIRVNCLCPGTSATPLVEASIRKEKDPAGAKMNLEQVRPMKRLGTPEEQAMAILFLASEEIAYATGAILSVDGGYTAQ